MLEKNSVLKKNKTISDASICSLESADDFQFKEVSHGSSNVIYVEDSVDVGEKYFTKLSTENKEIENSDNTETNSLASFLRQFALDTNASHSQINYLLKGLPKFFSTAELPSDARTLLKTQRTITTVKIDSQRDTPGEFVYFGLKTGLVKILDNEVARNEINVTKTINLIFNIDGVPIFKSHFM